MRLAGGEAHCLLAPIITTAGRPRGEGRLATHIDF